MRDAPWGRFMKDGIRLRLTCKALRTRLPRGPGQRRVRGAEVRLPCPVHDSSPEFPRHLPAARSTAASAACTPSLPVG